jgi:hypothetical protein
MLLIDVKMRLKRYSSYVVKVSKKRELSYLEQNQTYIRHLEDFRNLLSPDIAALHSPRLKRLIISGQLLSANPECKSLAAACI